MRNFTAALVVLFCIQARSQLISKDLLFYDANRRDDAFVTDSFFRGMEPHDGSAGIVIFGDVIPTDSDGYTAPPRGPLVLSFVQHDKPATVSRLDFWVSNPLGFLDYPTPVVIKVFDAEGSILASQEIASLEFPVSIRREGRIASVQIGDEDYPKYMMVSDIHFDHAHVVHASHFQLNDPRQFDDNVTTINFETLPDGTPPGVYVSTEWQQLGVLFSDENGNAANIYPAVADNLLATRSGTNGLTSAGRTLVIQFVDPKSGKAGVVTEAGVWIVNAGWELAIEPTTAQFLDADGKVIETTKTSGKFFFAGAHSKKGIARMILSDPDAFLADDLQFSPIRLAR